MDMEKILDRTLDFGRKTAEKLRGFAKKTAESALHGTGKAAGKAVGFAKEKVGVVLHRTGEKVQSKAAQQQDTLLVLGFVFAALALLAFVLRAYGRKH